MVKMNLQFFGGRGSGGSTGSKNTKELGRRKSEEKEKQTTSDLFTEKEMNKIVKRHDDTNAKVLGDTPEIRSKLLKSIAIGKVVNFSFYGGKGDYSSSVKVRKDDKGYTVLVPNHDETVKSNGIRVGGTYKTVKVKTESGIEKYIQQELSRRKGRKLDGIGINYTL